MRDLNHLAGGYSRLLIERQARYAELKRTGKATPERLERLQQQQAHDRATAQQILKERQARRRVTSAKK